MSNVPAGSGTNPDPLTVYDDLRLGETVRQAKALARESARRAREQAERQLRSLGLPSSGQRQHPYSTIPDDGPNVLDTVPLDVLIAACEAAPTCPRCHCRATPWQPPGGQRRWVCFGCGFDPERPEP